MQKSPHQNCETFSSGPANPIPVGSLVSCRNSLTKANIPSRDNCSCEFFFSCCVRSSCGMLEKRAWPSLHFSPGLEEESGKVGDRIFPLPKRQVLELYYQTIGLDGSKTTSAAAGPTRRLSTNRCFIFHPCIFPNTS